jgi:hypothetical protein
MPQLDLACDCGAVAWQLDEAVPARGIRYTCHCDDCQAFAWFTCQPDKILDAEGGTDVYQLPASRLRVTGGLDRLACVQVTGRPLLRWYCETCRTPVANSYHTARLSFVSIPLRGASLAARDAALGPSSGHVWTKFGIGDLSQVKQVSIPAILWRMVSRMVGACLSGDSRNNPLFDRETGRPIAQPRRLTPEERAMLDVKVKEAALR